MKFRNETKFHICGLNQEKILNEISKSTQLTEIERHSKNETSFKCSYFEYKTTEKILKSKNIDIKEIKHQGPAYALKKIICSYGLICAMVLFSVFYFVQNQFILQYEINGNAKLPSSSIVGFLKGNYSSNKNHIDTKEVEISLVENFKEISFASCIIKGQTLVVNLKEKLLPDEMYGEFKPLVSQKDAKITEIDLISGTLAVKVGDIVRKGDILVEPYTVDTSGNIKKVEAKAEIKAEVYNEGTVDHYETFIEVKRTGKMVEQNDITLFGLKIYSFKDDMDFKMYEVEYEDLNLVKNLFLPFKMRKIKYYELQERIVETKFDDVKDDYIEKAREKALEKCEDCDTIVDEYYTLRHLSGVTVVNYCIITDESIGGYQ